jgi:ribosome-binding factor A
MSERTDRFVDGVKNAAAEFINLESSRTSLITITNAVESNDGKQVTVLFTTFPEEKEEVALHFLRRKRSEFKEYLKSHMRLKHIPFVEFDIDHGEKHRQHIDKVLKEE